VPVRTFIHIEDRSPCPHHPSGHVKWTQTTTSPPLGRLNATVQIPPTVHRAVTMTHRADLLSRTIPNPPTAPTLAPGQDPAKYDSVQLLHTPLQEMVSLKELQDASADDPILSTVSTRQGWLVKVSDELLAYSRIREELSFWNNICLGCGRCTVVPGALRARVLTMAHKGHLSIVRLKQRCRDVVWWPGIDREIETLVKDFTACLLSIRTRASAPTPPMQLLD